MQKSLVIQKVRTQQLQANRGDCSHGKVHRGVSSELLHQFAALGRWPMLPSFPQSKGKQSAFDDEDRHPIIDHPVGTVQWVSVGANE